jgi:hypothetical protein
MTVYDYIEIIQMENESDLRVQSTYVHAII